MPWTDDETKFAAESLIEAFGPFDTPKELEAFAAELVEKDDVYDDGPEAARAIAADLRRRALILRNR